MAAGSAGDSTTGASYYSPNRMVLITKKEKFKMPKKLLSKKDIHRLRDICMQIPLFPVASLLEYFFHLFCICVPGVLYLLLYLLCICCCPEERYEWEDSCRLLCFTLRHSWRGRGVVTTNLPDCPTYHPLTKLILNI